MNVSRADVAREAGVSVSTVSYVLNGSRHITDRTRNKVMNAIKKLDYCPDLVARSMAKSISGGVAIIADELSNPIQAEVIAEFERAASVAGHFITISTMSRTLAEQSSDLISNRISGVFITAFPYEGDYDFLRSTRDCIRRNDADDGIHGGITRLLRNGISVVASRAPDPRYSDMSYICPDYDSGIKLLTEHLFSLGHIRFAMLSAFSRDFPLDDRLASFEKRVSCLVTEAPVSVCGEYPYPSDVAAGRRLAIKLLESGAEFTAVLCTNDLMAYGCIAELTNRGIRVPEDVSVAGIDNISLSSSLNPTLTTAGYDKQDYGRKAFELLKNMLNGKGASSLSYGMELFVRESTGPVRL